METVLVTGGGGFIGSHLSDRLIDEGKKVIAVDNFCSSKEGNVEHLEDNENFKLIEKDILTHLNIEEEIDYVMHFASRASPKDYQENPIHTLRTNTEGTLKMLELADRHDAKFMYASTSEVFGDPEQHPQTEDYWGNVNPNGPRACYDEGKRCGEATIASYAKKNNLDYRIIRIFNTYGPRMMEDDGRVITNFINQALEDEPITVYGDGKQTRSFCYIDDLVNGIRKAMKSEHGEVFNLGNPEEKTILELAETIREIIDTESDITFHDLPEDDPERRKPDIKKAKKNLSWKPEISLEKGLKKTTEHYRDE
jgi:nucleoside-diphosphate-sugar epimerase